MKYLEIEMMAVAVKVSVEGRQVCVALADGREVRFPADLNKRLKGATPKQLGNVELICNGTGLHWPDLDEDLSVQGILDGRFGQAAELATVGHR